MSFDLAQLKTNVETLIAALDGSQDIEYLLSLQKAAFGAGVSVTNQNLLDARIQTAADAQTSSTDIEDILLANKAMAATQAVINTYFDTKTVLTSNGNYPVPSHATKCFVSCTAGSSRHINGVGAYVYFGGAYVVEFEIGVSAGGTINIEVGSGTAGTHVVGALQVFNGIASNSNSGITRVAGVVQSTNGATVFAVPNTSAIGVGLSASDISLKFLIEEPV